MPTATAPLRRTASSDSSFGVVTAMTTERVYQKAMDTFPALKIMLSLQSAYEPEFLKAFVLLMGPSGLGD